MSSSPAPLVGLPPPHPLDDSELKREPHRQLLGLHWGGLAQAVASFALLVLSTALREGQWIDGTLSKVIGLLAGAALMVSAVGTRLIGNYRLLGKELPGRAVAIGRRTIHGVTVWLTIIAGTLVGAVIAHLVHVLSGRH
jgi:hypothetical protein